MELVILGQVVLVVAVYFLFIRVKMDPRVQDLADAAYLTASNISGLWPKGDTPPVNLKDGAWEVRGVNVIGNYKWVGFFGKVLWDRILVVNDKSYIWRNLVHEMTHAVRRRKGKKSSEAAAEAAEAVADAWAPTEVALMLRNL